MFFIDNSDTEVEFDESLLLNNESSLNRNDKTDDLGKSKPMVKTSSIEKDKKNVSSEKIKGPESSELIVRTMVEMIETDMDIKNKDEFKDMFSISKRIDYNSHNEEGLIKIKYDGESLGDARKILLVGKLLVKDFKIRLHFIFVLLMLFHYCLKMRSLKIMHISLRFQLVLAQIH